MIGIDRNTGLVYEGTSVYGHGVWPTPVIAPALLIESPADWDRVPGHADVGSARLVFREDSYDPASRVRRGRLYSWQDGQAQPQNWFVQQHPALFEDTGHRNHEGRFSKSLLTYHPVSRFAARLRKTPGMMIVMGGFDAMTVWYIVSVELIALGAELITLRSRSNLGVLPELDRSAFPYRGANIVDEALGKVADAAFRGAAASVIDLCRDAVQVVISHWLVQQGAPEPVLNKDLGALVKDLKDGMNRQALVDAADLVRILHPRGKSNEQNRLGLRPPSDQDGELAIQALGFILREVGWTR